MNLRVPCIRAVLAGFCLGFSWSATAPATLLDDLLNIPAPEINWRDQIGQFPPTPAPAADAPLAQIAEYWQWADGVPTPERPVQLRLLEWCDSHPGDLRYLIQWFPTDVPAFHDRVNAICARIAADYEQTRKYQISGEVCYAWLRDHSRYLRRQLIQETKAAFEQPSGDDLNRMMPTLARLDPKAAQKLLAEQAGSKDPFIHAAAICWSYRLHSSPAENLQATRWRAELRQLVSNRSASPRVRDYALLSVMETVWPNQTEQEAWFLSLFSDPTLGEYRDPEFTLRPLLGVVRKNPERWIPKIIPLIGAKDPATHQNAVLCLSNYLGSTQWLPPEILDCLLPWVSDPSWIGLSTGRETVIASLRQIERPDLIPALIKIVEKEPQLLETAAGVLRKYRATEAGPALRSALDRPSEGWLRDSIAETTAVLGGYPVEEMEAAVEAYATQQADFDRLPAVGEGQPPNFPKFDAQATLGENLTKWPIENSELVARLLKKADLAAAEHPDVADGLKAAVAGWPGRAAATSLVNDLKTGSPTARWIQRALLQRQHRNPVLTEASGFRGISLGIHTAIVGEAPAFLDLLTADDLQAQIGLLACARILRLALPIERVEPLLDSPNPELHRAAETFLIADDTPAARRAVQKRHPGEALIFGRSHWGPNRATFDDLQRQVKKDDGPLEIYALHASLWTRRSDIQILIYADRTELLCLDDNGRRRRRILAPAEIEAFQSWTKTHHIDERRSYEGEASHGTLYEYCHLTKDVGDYISIYEPPYPGQKLFIGVSGETRGEEWVANPIYGRLVQQFQNLSADTTKVTYEHLQQLPGFRLVHPREKGPVESLLVEKGRRLVKLESGSHYRLGNRGVDMTLLDLPDSYRDDQGMGRWKNQFEKEYRALTGPHEGRLAGYYLWKGTRKSDSTDGLWACNEKREPFLVGQGSYAMWSVSSDGEWVLAWKFGEAPDIDPRIVRLRVKDRREFPVEQPPAQNASSLSQGIGFAWLPGKRQFLIHPVAEPGYRAEEVLKSLSCYLIDPETGAVERAMGDFRPFVEFQISRSAAFPARPLQPARLDGKIWAALPFPASNGQDPRTEVGRYDTSNLSFQTVFTVPGTLFSSRDLWIDEKKRQAVIVVNGDVLELSLP